MAKEYINYSSMLGMTEKYSDEKLDEIIAEYKEEQKKHQILHSSSAQNHDFFKRNVDGLERMKAERKRIKIAKEFVLKSDHVKILNKIYFQMNDRGVLFGTLPDEKEIASLLDIKSFDQDGNYFEEDSNRVDLIIEELQYAIKEIIKLAL